MVLGIYLDPLHPDTMEEVYEFRISYPDKLKNQEGSVSIHKGSTEIISVPTKKEIKKSTQQMMRRKK